MAAGVSMTVEAGDLQRMIAEVEKMRGAVESDKIKSEMGFAVMQTVREHFALIAQDDEHHKSANSLGADRTGFYERARQNTQQPTVVPEGVVVSILQAGIAQRYFGGDIDAKPGGYLTIPALAAAYGRRAREFDLRFVIFGKTGKAALLDAEGSVYYWLVRHVTQSGDATILPTEEEMIVAAQKAAGDYMDAVWSNQASP
jgi:hypothetical protein